MTDKWNRRFLDMAEMVASWSKDPSTKCGAVIVRPDRTIASAGFNGFPKGCDDADEIYLDRPLKYARVVHAEMNAIIHAHEPLEGYTMYCTPANIGPACDRCAAHIIQAGIKTIVHEMPPAVVEESFVDRWGESIQRGLDMFEEAGVEVVALEPAVAA